MSLSLEFILLELGAVDGVPSIDDLSGDWFDPTAAVSTEAGLGPEQRDLAAINNFWGERAEQRPLTSPRLSLFLVQS